MECSAQETDRTQQWEVKRAVDDDADVDWTTVRWTIDVVLWCGGQDNSGHRVGTTGPVHMWRLAIYEDGSPADYSWVNVTPEYPMQFWDMAFCTLLGTLNFMTCRNVEIVEPQRARAQARRIERTGVTVSTIKVFPAGKSSRGSRKGESRGVPLTSVRGHFAEYGEQFGKGLLFGKLSGRFWVPQFARGDASLGEPEQKFVVHTR